MILNPKNIISINPAYININVASNHPLGVKLKGKWEIKKGAGVYDFGIYICQTSYPRTPLGSRAEHICRKKGDVLYIGQAVSYDINKGFELVVMPGNNKEPVIDIILIDDNGDTILCLYSED